MSRPLIAHIQLDAFKHNYQLAKARHGGKALAVIKANAYGHGAIQCAKAIETIADGFAVACIEEALSLRNAGIKQPILLLEGFFEATELDDIVANDLWIVLHAVWQVEIFLNAKLIKPVQVWLKLDSGMHRVGLSTVEFQAAYEKLKGHQNVSHIVSMSHFANADNINSLHTKQQYDLFNTTIAHLKADEMSLANSAAILAWPQTHKTWARPGIMLYGADPLLNVDSPLRPVMQLTSKVIAVQNVNAGQSIGYGSTFTAKCDTKVGIVACGYADGYPRTASNHAPAAVDSVKTQLIGRVSMDMLFVDLTHIPYAGVGSHVELWGNQVLANDVAKAANTIAYELFCNVKRAQFKYT